MKAYRKYVPCSKLILGFILSAVYITGSLAKPLIGNGKARHIPCQLSIQKPILNSNNLASKQNMESNDIMIDLLLPPELRLLRNSVYFIKITNVQVYFKQSQEIIDISKYGLSWSGTGFLLETGEFITARHVIQPWRFISGCKSWNQDNERGEAILAYINNAEIAGGSVEVIYEARSGDGDIFTFSNRDVIFNQSGDELLDCEKLGSDKQLKTCPIYNSASDWAKLTLNNRKGLLKLNREISRTLSQETPIYGYGYSYGLFLQGFNQERIAPILIKGEIVQDRTMNGMINIAANGLAQGSSGGPMMIKNAIGEYEVIGIISSGFIQVQQLVPAYEIR
ncbi:MAG: hypothetical protein IPM34_07580 [Saprospiraceae bacterium]|nr:hypothetical protein [Saprospiraceae bacterium]